MSALIMQYTQEGNMKGFSKWVYVVAAIIGGLAGLGVYGLTHSPQQSHEVFEVAALPDSNGYEYPMPVLYQKLNFEESTEKGEWSVIEADTSNLIIGRENTISNCHHAIAVGEGILVTNSYELAMGGIEGMPIERIILTTNEWSKVREFLHLRGGRYNE